MMTGGRLFLLLIVLAVVASIAAPQKAKKQYQHEFGAEVDVRRPVHLPGRVFRQVLKNGGGLYVDESPAQFKKRVVGTFIDLDGNARRDFLVQGDHGANITGFWLFRNVNGRMRLVLHVRALSLWIGPKSSQGVKVVEAGAASASRYWGVRYVFAKGQYRPIKCWEEEFVIDEAAKKKRRFPCSRDGSMPYKER